MDLFLEGWAQSCSLNPDLTMEFGESWDDPSADGCRPIEKWLVYLLVCERLHVKQKNTRAQVSI